MISKEEILKASRELIKKKGLNSINMRSLAEAANISVGSIYNFFKSKDELTIAVISSVWFDIFHTQNISLESDNFINIIDTIFYCLDNGNKKYPNFFSMHSTMIFGKNKDKGIKMMNHIKKHIRDNLYKTLMNDKRVKEDAFNDNFTADKFIDIIFSFIITYIINGNYDSSSIKEIIRRTIY
ncbi:TetR/AcrR family transcriptional regulator [uncultured Brachyspira sp.]|uniref:TetR/AcrR family transcriptional regulator n=1 Tax=uncultured Brachyspira sp. TaxID=221953 RepID=UPI0025E68E03|nr:TetR/AcrR family transcriptional regulator [uncultured Brachyspira sp.]